MWKNYLKIAIRNSFKDKYYIIINVFGLGVAMAFGLTIYILHAYNIEFDSYYSDTDDIVRLHCLKPNAQGRADRFELAPIPMAQMVADEISGIADHTRYISSRDNLKYTDQVFNQTIGYVDANFFEFFPMNFKAGGPAGLANQNVIYLTEEIAEKYFGETNPVGEIMTIHYGNERFVDLNVAGVFDRIPMNSSFMFDALVPYIHYLYGNEIEVGDWSPWQQTSAFFRLSPNAELDDINQSIKKYVAVQNEAREEWKVSDFQLIAFKDADLLKQGTVLNSETNMRLRSEVIMVFTVLALLILLIVSFNLANTSMALMSRRFKEIGIRKAMGSGSRHIFTQFMFEMSWTSFLGLITGVALFHWVSQGFFAIWDIPYETADFSFFRLVLAFTGVYVLAAFFSGLSPALYSRRLQPTSIFQKSIKMKRSNRISQVLISLQFAISLTLIIAGIVFTQNADFLKMLDIGYERERLITVWVDSESEFNGLSNEISAMSNVTAYAATNDHFGWSYEDSFIILDTGKTEVRTMRLGRNYMKVMGVDIFEGRAFDFDRSSDLNEHVIVNEAYVDQFQLDDTIGAIVNLEGSKKYIIGVMRNTIDHVYEDFVAVPKIMLPTKDADCKTIIVKAGVDKEEEVFESLKAAWKRIVSDRPFNGRYQDDITVGYALQDNNNLRTIFYYMAILGGVLSITGIFALSSLNVSRRIKEIGIRKVLGASTQRIILLMNREFGITMLAALIIGSALGYLLTNQLLEFIYRYHISIGPGAIVASGLIVFVAAFLTTSATIFGAANTNPSETLRDE